MARKAACLPQGTRISDFVTLGVLTATVPGELIDGVLADTGRQSRRYRQLPARLVVYYVMALALYAQASYSEVLRCLLEGLRWLRLKGQDQALVSKSAITKARIRLGIAPLKELFERVAQPLAEPGLAGAWYRGRRLVSLDGTTIDLPDEPDLERHFGRPSASRGASSFPQVRLLALMETGTHAIFAAAIGRYDTSEVQLAPVVLERLRSGMLCLADRAFVGFALWRMATAADLVWRQPDTALSWSLGGRFVPEPPVSVSHASPPRRRRNSGAGHRVSLGRDSGWRAAVSSDHHPARSGRGAGGGTGRPVSRALGGRERVRRIEGHVAGQAADAALPPCRPGRTGTLCPAARPPGAAPADGRGQPQGRL